MSKNFTTLILIFSLLPVSVFAQNYKGKKILYIDSYHTEYEWSKDVTKGVTDILKDTGAQLKIHCMDTKRNRAEEFKKSAALKAKTVIEEFKPDVVIASDDNASKYLIVPYFKNTDIPFVFCGINWDASVYGFPCKNVTGMVEVSLIAPLIKQLRNYAKGSKTGFLSIDSLTQRKMIEYQTKQMKIIYDKTYFANSFDEWKKYFLKLQKEADMLIVSNTHGMENWNEEKAGSFAVKHTVIPAGTMSLWNMPYTMLGYIQIPNEQGEWAARTALRILDGTKPQDIPVAQNKRGKLMLNIKIVKKLGILIDRAVYKRAEIVK